MKRIPYWNTNIHTNVAELVTIRLRELDLFRYLHNQQGSRGYFTRKDIEEVFIPAFIEVFHIMYPCELLEIDLKRQFKYALDGRGKFSFGYLCNSFIAHPLHLTRVSKNLYTLRRSILS